MSSDFEINKGRFQNIEIIIEDSKVRILHNSKDLKTFDFIWLFSLWSKRDVAYGISSYLNNHDIPHTERKEGRGTSKISDIIKFALANLPQPNTYYSCKYTEESIPKIKITCGFPMIAKRAKGSKGKGIFIIKSLRDLKKALTEIQESTSQYFFQAFIANDYDWGVLISNGNVLSGEKSFGMEGKYVNNAAQGAEEIFVPINDIPSEVKDIALKAAKELKLDWSRSDIVIDKKTNKPFILETNRFPGMTVGSPEEDAFVSFIQSELKLTY